MPDITYTNDGMFTRFMPHTEAGERIWRSIAAKCEGGAVLAAHTKSVISDIRRAGYTITRGTVQKLSTADADALADELADF